MRNPAIIISALFLVVAALAAGFFVVGDFLKEKDVDAFGRNEIASNGNVQGELYPGDPRTEARLVQREDERLIYVRTVASAARWRVDGLKGPYRLRTDSTFTLVLPARETPYTVADLLQLAPKAFVRHPGGAYLLSENIVVLPGANLSLATAKGAKSLDLRLESSAGSFVSLVALGGSVTIAGTKDAKVSITSWDSTKASPDFETRDGRSYIRLIGGHAKLSHARVANLGFWSGNTGGLSLTGTNTISPFKPAAPPPKPAPQDAAIAGARLLSDKQLETLHPADEDYSVVTAGIDNAVFENNAFGLFAANARDVAVQDTAIRGSLVDGLVLHRFVTNAAITRTTSSNNAVDGFTLGRSTTGVVLDGVTAQDNGRNGVSLDGRPLSDGPNAVGTAVEIYGRNRITGSTLKDNRRYGVEISGGARLRVAGNTFEKNQVGVVVNHAARDVVITGNKLRHQKEHAIAIREAGASAVVSKNLITGADTGVYVRNARADVTANRLAGISNHGITLRGRVAGTQVAGNTVSGYGSIAIWAEESAGGAVGENNLLGWQPEYTLQRVANFVFQPLTFVWLVLGALLLVTALSGGRRRRTGTIRNPYAERVPLTSLSKGILAPEEIGERE
ncbi:right-handed parallel beta-helix repeat-containing protein [Arthrobacter sp. Marseille-P9274]|uniref:right-handed parallel beta-helix repeat-containing protein n=1 Tax=Arthrobacter sp. Marseille-P9274 TaxID=2866572 RepID=UPI0021C85681|nr:right-handed parallel beta-helix repeat-containing protein [Arthrobacter sp. Marseille-P9274]